ncbi:50S ribosomal protein L25 [Desulfomarina sp.]
MLQVEMSASLRSVAGKGAMRRLRMDGMTPAVVYGSGGDAVSLQLETKTLTGKLLDIYRRNAIVTLKIDGKEEKSVLIGEVQTHPVRDTLIHVDFCEIDLEKDRAFDVPVFYDGPAKGEDLGGELLVHNSTIVLEGKPLDIPDECTVNIKEMVIGDVVKCGDIALPEGIKMKTDPKAIAIAVVKAGIKIDPEDMENTEEEEEAAEVEAAA